MSDIIALIPARGGSQRIPRKNIRELAGHPLIAYTIAAAKQSGIFKVIFVSTEDDEIGRLALSYGGVCWIKRPEVMAASESPDIEWITHALNQETYCAQPFDQFAILRPTSPFRTAETIKRAWSIWQHDRVYCDSLRAVERAMPPPCKMWESTWKPDGSFELRSLCRHVVEPGSPPHHSRASQTLPVVYVQNASLEIAWSDTVLKKGSISGNRIMPFFSQDYEGFDLNSELDWIVAETLVERKLSTLPEVA